MVVEKSRLLVDIMLKASAPKETRVSSLTVALVVPSKQGKLQVFVEVGSAPV